MRYFLIFFDSVATVAFSVALFWACSALMWWFGAGLVASFVGGMFASCFIWFVVAACIEYFQVDAHL